MLAKGYNPANYGGKVWWNENNEGMRAIWGTQTDYDEHIKNGGTWEEYAIAARARMTQNNNDELIGTDTENQMKR